MKIPVGKISAAIAYTEGLCASVLIDRVIKRVRNRDNESKLEKVVFDIGAHAISAAASAYFIDRATKLLLAKDSDIEFPPKKSPNKDAKMDPQRVAEVEKSLKIEEYVHGLINTYGDGVYRMVNALRESPDGTIFASEDDMMASHWASSYTDWKEFIDVLNEFHKLMCSQNDGWNFEDTCNDVKKMIQNHWDSLEANKKHEQS